jgi:hypothetical protein
VDVAASGVEGITPSRRARSSARVADDILGAEDGRAEHRRAPRRSPLQARARESATRQHASPRFSPPGWQPRHRGARSPLELLSRERPRRGSVSSPRSRARPRRSEQTAACTLRRQRRGARRPTFLYLSTGPKAPRSSRRYHF